MYKLCKKNPSTNKTDVVQNLETTSFIPFDLANKDYQAYLAWVAKGNTPLPADE